MTNNKFSFLIINIFIFSYIGALPLYFGWDEYRAEVGVSDRQLILTVCLFSTVAMLGLMVGYRAGLRLLGGRKLSSVSTLVPRAASGGELAWLVILVVFCFLVLCFYLLKLPEIGINKLVSGDGQGLAMVRSKMTNDFPGKYHWYSVIMHDLFNMVTFALFSAWVLSRKKIVLVLFVIAFVGSGFSAIMGLEKAPFAWLLFGVLLTYCLTSLEGRVPIRALVILSTLLLVILSFLSVAYISDDFVSKSVESVESVESVNKVEHAVKLVFSRVFTGSLQPAYHYLEFFPAEHNYLLGKSFPNPAGVIPYESYNLTGEVMNWKYPEIAKTGVVGTMPAVFWGEAYANFGIAGVFIVPVIIGLMLFFVSFFFSEVNNSPLKIGFLVWVILHYKDLSITGFSGHLFDFKLTIILAVFLLMKLTTIHLNERSSSNNLCLREKVFGWILNKVKS